MVIGYLYLQVIDKKTLNDVGLKYLPEGWHRMIDIPHSKWMDTAMKKYNTDWSISHISAESFFENKHGKTFGFFFIIISCHVGRNISFFLTIL